MGKITRRIEMFFFSILLFAILAASVSAGQQTDIKILLLPLAPMGDAGRALCDEATAKLAEGLRELNLFQLTVAPDLLAELNFKEYQFNNKNLKRKIHDIGNFDYILSGFVHLDGGKGLHTLELRLSVFSSWKEEYHSGSGGTQNIETYVKSHIASIKKLKIFIPENDQEKVRTKHLAILKKYSPATFAIIDMLLKKNSHYDLLKYTLDASSLTVGFNTAVHEGTHIFNHSSVKPGTQAQDVYINPAETIRVTRTETFPQKELAGEIPERLRTFRFSNYIEASASSSSTNSTQDDGIYHLLDEFDAYYQGTLVSCDLFQYYRDYVFYTGPYEIPSVYLDFINGIYITYFAYYEFKFFIYTYLLYAQREKKTVYREIINNSDFIRAFKKIDVAYGGLIERVYEIERELDGCLKKIGKSLQKEGKWTGIVSNGVVRESRNNHQDTVILLKEELDREIYRELEKKVFR